MMLGTAANAAKARPSPAAFTHPTTPTMTSFEGGVLARSAQADYIVVAAMEATMARRLLGETEVPIGQIAAALGKSEGSAFTRAFQRWSGQTPTTWRTEDHHG